MYIHYTFVLLRVINLEYSYDWAVGPGRLSCCTFWSTTIASIFVCSSEWWDNRIYLIFRTFPFGGLDSGDEAPELLPARSVLHYCSRAGTLEVPGGLQAAQAGRYGYYGGSSSWCKLECWQPIGICRVQFTPPRLLHKHSTLTILAIRSCHLRNAKPCCTSHFLFFFPARFPFSQHQAN